MSYIIIGLVLAGGLAFYYKNRKLNPANKASIDSKANAYGGLRKMALSTTPEQLGLTLPADQTSVFGVMMDWEMDGAIATTVSYLTGDTSLYLTSGGGVIGGSQHESVRIAAKQFVAIAQTYLAKSTKAEIHPLPAKHQVNFYLLTNNGIFVGREQIENFEDNSSDWLELFEEGNKVLNELRLSSQNA